MKPETEKLLQKSFRSIGAAERLLKEGDVDFAASRAYYALFYVAEALLNERDLQFKKHGGVHGAFAEHFIKTKQMDTKFHSWLVDAFDERIQGDYEVESQVDSAIVKTTIQQAQEFLQAAQQYLTP
ncbi:MAG: HEPN domain-containing protein [Candidatus Omnitrophica bacterium]|nr:HEPN domain-containing protein [Candidatus Omnitrophota bacterium]